MKRGPAPSFHLLPSVVVLFSNIAHFRSSLPSPIIDTVAAAAMTSTAKSAASTKTTTTTTTTTRVAVLGSGIAGCAAARRIAEHGLSVTVYERGSGVGGRMSTRVTRDERQFAFDHGAQYVGEPKTPAFRQAVDDWVSAGCVREWKGRFASAGVSPAAAASTGEDSCSSHISIKEDGGNRRRYVGYPAMNEICAHLLDHENIDVVLRTRACAAYDDGDSGDTGGPRWKLTSHEEDGGGKEEEEEELGRYYWLVGGDRLSAGVDRADLKGAPQVLRGFADDVAGQVASVPILTLMVALESPLSQIPYDGIRFDEEGCAEEFGSLGWIARDTSKPGRDRADGAECWVVQSGPKTAQKILSSLDDGGEGGDFEAKRELARQKAKEVLLEDFKSVVRKLADKSGDGAASIPRVLSAVGHRWSAAFPSVVAGTKIARECYVDVDHNFVACGDYMGSYIGRVEGAYLSGVAAADSLLDAIRR